MALKDKPLGYKLSAAWLSICVLMATLGWLLPLPKWKDSDPDALGMPMFSKGHIFGTDNFGVDQLSAIINGTRISLGVAVVSVTLGAIIGSLLGVLAGYARGWIDIIISMYFNVTLAFPTLVLLLALVAIFASPDPFNPGTTLPRMVVLTFAITFVLIPFLGRLARAATVSWAGRDFVLVAKSLGLKRRTILLHHIIPNVLPSLISVSFLAAGIVIIVEGGLSILGAGGDPGSSWGSLLARNRGDIAEAPHTTFLPVIAIALTVMAFNYFGEFLRTSIDNRDSRI
ncbi:MAG: ABC transporter permease [Ilumatobacteraceae bacterium]|nr:ABC transporter permease [Ilumatobacteraceae bacterium]